MIDDPCDDWGIDWEADYFRLRYYKLIEPIIGDGYKYLFADTIGVIPIPESITAIKYDRAIYYVERSTT